jgi:hypothetical protein
MRLKVSSLEREWRVVRAVPWERGKHRSLPCFKSAPGQIRLQSIATSDGIESVRAALKFEVRVKVDPGDTNAEIEGKAWKQADNLAEAFLKRER